MEPLSGLSAKPWTSLHFCSTSRSPSNQQPGVGSKYLGYCSSEAATFSKSLVQSQLENHPDISTCVNPVQFSFHDCNHIHWPLSVVSTQMSDRLLGLKSYTQTPDFPSWLIPRGDNVFSGIQPWKPMRLCSSIQSFHKHFKYLLLIHSRLTTLNICGPGNHIWVSGLLWLPTWSVCSSCESVLSRLACVAHINSYHFYSRQFCHHKSQLLTIARGVFHGLSLPPLTVHPSNCFAPPLDSLLFEPPRPVPDPEPWHLLFPLLFVSSQVPLCLVSLLSACLCSHFTV